MLVDTPYNAITKDIIGSAIEVHRALGPGLLESVYTPCLQYELSARSLRWRAQQPIPIIYKGIALDVSYRVDLIIEDCVVVEVKSVDNPIRRARRTAPDVLATHREPGGADDQLQRCETDGRSAATTQSTSEERSFRSAIASTPVTALRAAMGR